MQIDKQVIIEKFKLQNQEKGDLKFNNIEELQCDIDNMDYQLRVQETSIQVMGINLVSYINNPSPIQHPLPFLEEVRKYHKTIVNNFSFL